MTQEKKRNARNDVRESAPVIFFSRWTISDTELKKNVYNSAGGENEIAGLSELRGESRSRYRYISSIYSLILLRVIIEPLSTFPPKPARVYHLPQQNRGPVFAVPKLLMQYRHNG